MDECKPLPPTTIATLAPGLRVKFFATLFLVTVLHPSALRQGH